MICIKLNCFRVKDDKMKIGSKSDWPELIVCPQSKCTLVLSPHIDDDVIGCFGTLMKMKQRKTQIVVVYCGAGNISIPGQKLNCELQLQRKQEAMNALRIVCEDLKAFFLDLPESSEDDWDTAKDELNGLIRRYNPDTIMLPYYTDSHPDHWKTNLLFRHSMDLVTDPNIYAYEVWTPFVPDVIINITNEMEKKQLAIKAHKSQISKLRYDKLILGLNMYRASFIPFPNMDYAEAFKYFRCSEYMKQIDQKLKKEP